MLPFIYVWVMNFVEKKKKRFICFLKLEELYNIYKYIKKITEEIGTFNFIFYYMIIYHFIIFWFNIFIKLDNI